MWRTLNKSLLILVFVSAFLVIPYSVFGCAKPPTKTVLQGYEDADAVVIVRAVSVQKVPDGEETPLNGSHVISTAMEVKKVFKGSARVGDKLIFGQGNGIRCTWVFYEQDVGKEYLLYLGPPPEDEELWYEDGFSRSHMLEYAQDDLLYLNKINEVRGRTRVSGVLDDDNLAGLSVEGQTIRIIGKNKTYFAKTDKNGVYELYDVPPGRYVLEPELKFGWKVDEFDLTRAPTRREMMRERQPSNRVAFTLRPRKHFGIDIKLKLSNHIGGTIKDSNGKPLQWVCVSLTRANEERYLGCNDLTDERGRFQIDAVEAGIYTLILNYENKRTAKMPFPKLYYPGVPDRDNAKQIVVKHGESVDHLNVTIRR